MSITNDPLAWNDQSLITDLLQAPARIAVAETALLQATRAKLGAVGLLRETENGIRIAVKADGTPVLDGKNEATRNAQLAELTQPFQADVDAAERLVEDARLALNRTLNEFAALRAVSRIVSAIAD